MKALLIDDHPLIQEGIRLVLERHYSPVTLLSAFDFGTALRIIEAESDFNLVIFDLGLPDIDGYEGLGRIRRDLRDTPIIVLSAADDPVGMRRALAMGAKGYVQKSASYEVMVNAIHMVLNGSEYVPLAALNGCPLPETGTVTHAQTSLTQPAPGNCAPSALSKRQLQVLRLVIQGKTNKEIGRALSISDTTARTHITAIFRAMNVSNRTEACFAAMRMGLWPDASLSRQVDHPAHE